MSVYRSNRNTADQLYLGDKKKLEASHLNKTNPVIVYIHGFSESANGGQGQSGHEIRDGNFNK